MTLRLLLQSHVFIWCCSRVCAHLKLASKCRFIMIVISPGLLQDEQCVKFFEHTVAEQYRRFIFVRYRAIADQWTERNRAVKAAYKVGRKVSWPESDERRYKRKREHFYKQLRYWLPTPQVHKANSEHGSSAVQSQPDRPSSRRDGPSTNRCT